jgi:septum formation protein
LRLLLASKSDARRRMLEQAGVPFELADAPFDEEVAKAELAGLAPREIAGRLAALKAGSVASDAGDLVLGSDQVLELDDGTMLSKPGSREEAAAQLRRMSGRTHRLHSAAAIVEGSATVWRAIESVALTMRPLGDGFIRSYLDQEYEAIRWSVGGYRIEGPGAQLFERVAGNHFAVLGLPLLPLLAFLRERGLLAS